MIMLFITDIDGTLTDGGYFSPSIPEYELTGLGGGARLNLPPELYFRKFNTKDFVGIKMLHDAGIKTVALTGSYQPSKPQFDRSAPYMIIAAGVQDKYEWVRSTYVDCSDRPDKYTWDEIAFIGDELNDIKLLDAVGLPGCPADAAREVLDLVKSKDDGCVMCNKGGELAVREFTDLIRVCAGIKASWCNWEEE